MCCFSCRNIFPLSVFCWLCLCVYSKTWPRGRAHPKTTVVIVWFVIVVNLFFDSFICECNAFWSWSPPTHTPPTHTGMHTCTPSLILSPTPLSTGPFYFVFFCVVFVCVLWPTGFNQAIWVDMDIAIYIWPQVSFPMFALLESRRQGLLVGGPGIKAPLYSHVTSCCEPSGQPKPLDRQA